MRHPATAIEARARFGAAARRSGLLALLAAPPGSTCRDEALRAALLALPPGAIPSLLERIAFHRIDGLACRALDRLPQEGLDPWLRSSLRRRHQRFAAATLAQGMALAELLDDLHRRGVPVVVMRGLRSVESIYGDVGSRPFEDHDLLVLPRDLGAARDSLLGRGFVEQAPGLLRRGGMIVDLHVDPLGARRRPTREAVYPIATAPLFERAESVRVAGAPALALGLEDDLLLLAIHLVKHSFDRLIRTADLAHLLASRRDLLVWEALLERAASSNTRRLLGWALEAAVALGAPVPAALLPLVAPDSLEAVLMHRVLDQRPVPYTGEILMVLAAPTLGARLRFLWDALFPAGESAAGPWERAAALPRRSAELALQAARQAAERRKAR